MLTPLGLVVALALSAPALWDVVQGSLGLVPALLRLLAAFIVVAIGTVVLRRVTAPGPVRTSVPPPEAPARRRQDS